MEQYKQTEECYVSMQEELAESKRQREVMTEEMKKASKEMEAS